MVTDRQRLQQQVRKALIADPRSAAEIARRSGVHYVNLIQFRSGKRDLGAKSLAMVARLVGVETRVELLRHKPVRKRTR